MRLVFWLSAAFILYVYAGYPALMAVAARRAAARRRAVAPPVFPPVSIVVAARNEAARIVARVENLLALEYPARREIIVVSDGSTDETAGALKRFGAAVRVIELPAGGKAAALNVGVERAANDIIVFADARQRFAPDALLELIRPFSDPKVGAATGELVLDCEVPDRRLAVDRRAISLPAPVSHERRSSEDRRGLDSTIADGLGLYWRYEKSIRRYESAVVVHARCDGRYLRDAPFALAAAAAGNDSRRRPRADAGRARRLPRRLHRAGARVRIGRPTMRTPRRAGRSVRSPVITRFWRSSRACCCRGAIRCGRQYCRTSSGGWSFRTTARRDVRRQHRSFRTSRCSTPVRCSPSARSTCWPATADGSSGAAGPSARRRSAGRVCRARNNGGREWLNGNRRGHSAIRARRRGSRLRSWC